LNIVIPNSEMSNSEYHSSPGISKSGLDLIAKSLAHYKAGYSGIDSDSSRIGTAFHDYVLEGGGNILEAPNRSRRSKDDKAFYDDFFLSNGAFTKIPFDMPAAEWFPEFERQTGKVILNSKEYAEVKIMANSISNNELAAELLSGGIAEQSMFAEYLDVDCRIRPDYESKGRLVDLKSTVSASRHDFRSSCAKYRYHVQDVFYSAIYNEIYSKYPEFYFVVVEKKPPYLCAVYQLDQEARENAHYLIERDLGAYKEAIENQHWPGYENDLCLDIPIYHKEKFDLVINGQEISV